MDSRNGNTTIYQKLSIYSKNSPKKFLKSNSPILECNNNTRESFFKKGNKTLRKDNIYTINNLKTENSEHKHDKFEQKFLESKKYCGDMGYFPSISFNKTNNNISKTPIVRYFNFRNKKFKIVNTEKKLPKILNTKSKSNFTSLQAKNVIKSKILGNYYNQNKIIHKNNTVIKYNENDKKSMISVTEKDEDEISSLNKIKFEKESQSVSDQKSGSKNSDDEDSKSGSNLE